jgi:ABC1 atypical kinase-like domain
VLRTPDSRRRTVRGPKFAAMNPFRRGALAHRTDLSLPASPRSVPSAASPLCQVVEARADNFPDPFIRRLGRFHDAVSPRPFSEMQAQIERELSRPMVDVFGAVDERPLAAASLAQVHKATLRDGTPVVVKVQDAEIARLPRVDLACLRIVARIAGRLYREIIERELALGRNAMAIWQDLVSAHGFAASDASVLHAQERDRCDHGRYSALSG